MKNQAPEHLRFAAVAVDIVIFSLVDKKLHVLVQNVNLPPHYINMPGFPGGIVTAEETADDAVERHLKDKVGLKNTPTEQLYTFSAVKRDKRNRVISIAHLGFLRPDAMAAYKHKTAKFVPVTKLGKLAYDHDEIYQIALGRLCGKLSYTTIAQYLLSNHFTLTELQDVYEVVLGKELDKRNFRKKILALDIVKETGKLQEGVKNRPAALYTFKSKEVKELSPIV